MTEALPVSAAQQAILFQSLAFGEGAYGTIGGWVDIRGPLEIASFVRAVELLPRRFAALTTVFALDDGRPTKRYAPEFPVDIAVVDLREAGGREAALHYANAMFREPLDVRGGKPPWICRILLADHEQTYALYGWHHAIADGVSVGVMGSEIHRIYNSLIAGEEPELAPIPSSLDGERIDRRHDRGLAYWTELIPRVPEPLFPAAPSLPIAADRLHTVWPWAEYRAVEELARAWEVPISALCLAALGASLSVRLRRASIVIGTPLHNRSSRDRNAVGPFTNVIPAPMDVPIGTPLRALAERLAADSRKHYRHASIALGDLAAAWGCANEARDPLDVTFSFEPVHYAPIAGCTIRMLALSPGSQLRPLQVYLRRYEEGEDASLDVDFGTNEPGATFAAGIACDMRALLANAAVRPDIRIDAAAFVDTNQRAKALGRGAGTGAVPERPTDLAAWFTAVAGEFAAAPALRCDEASLTYGELERRSAAIARGLGAMGIGAESRVGLACARGFELLVGMLGILRAGAAYVPLDPTYPAARLAYVIRDAGIVTILADDAGRGAFIGIEAALVSCSALEDAGSGLQTALPIVDPDRAAYVIYTSGTTGEPKGCIVTHRNVTRLLASCESWLAPTSADTWTLFHSYAFDFSVWEIWGALAYGGRLVIVPREVARDPAAFADLLVSERVTVLNQTPSAFRALALLDAEEPLRSTLRWVIFGGEALDFGSVASFVARHPSTRLMNMYGITETTVHVTTREVSKADARAGGPSLIGSALPDLHLQVLDAACEPVPIGAVGELCVGGAGVARGYLGRPGLTATRFVPDPAGAPGSRMYRSGDLGRIREDGDIVYLGRADHQVKIRGFRIELGEIEETLRRHDAVADAAATVLPGPAGPRIVAYVVGSVGEADPTALRSWLGERLPEHQLPAAIVPIAALPLTANGKLDRGALPAPVHHASGPTAEREPPRGVAEERLAAVWSEVLGMAHPPKRGENFFALGGDSMTALRLVARAKSHGLGLGLRDIYETTTLAELARRIELVGGDRAFADATPPAPLAPFALLSPADRALLPTELSDAYPLMATQAAMLFHSDLGASAAVFHDILDFDLTIPWLDDPEGNRWANAAARLTRHVALRTSFAWTLCSEPVQLVAAAATVAIPIVDLRSLSPVERELRYAAWRDTEAAPRFDIARPPLFRLAIHRLEDGRVRLSLVFHHAILDGWSLATLVTELVTAYVDPDRASGPAPALQSRCLAAEREAIENPATRAFWATRLARTSGAHHGFPALHAERDAPARRITRTMDGELADALQRRSAEMGVPLKPLLLAAHLRVLAAYAGHDEVCAGYVVNVRPEDDDAAAAVGLFLNTVPFALATGKQTWAELVRAVHYEDVALVPHRSVPTRELKRRASGKLPYFGGFNYVHFHVYEGLLALPGVAVGPVDVFEQTDFPFLCQFTRNPARRSLELTLVASEAVLPDTRADEMIDLHLAALRAIAWFPDRAVEETALQATRESADAIPRARVVASVHADATGAPSGLTEELLAPLWAEILGLDVDSVRRGDDFFACGGDSIAASRLSARITSAFGCKIRLQGLFEEPTFAATAAAIDATRALAAPVAARAPIGRAARVRVGAVE